jgi:hypothetical protein
MPQRISIALLTFCTYFFIDKALYQLDLSGFFIIASQPRNPIRTASAILPTTKPPTAEINSTGSKPGAGGGMLGTKTSEQNTENNGHWLW